jgi:hypothetical protein
MSISKFIITLVVIVTIASVGYTFYKTVIVGDFEVIETPEEGLSEGEQEITEDEEGISEDIREADIQETSNTATSTEGIGNQVQ